MNKDIQKLIKKNKRRNRFYQFHKPKKVKLNNKNEETKTKKFLLKFMNRVLISAMIFLVLLISKKDQKLDFIYKNTFTHLNFAYVDKVIFNNLGSIFPKLKDGNLTVNNSYISLDNSKNYESGVLVTTSPFESIQSHTSGIVIKKYFDDKYGETVVIQDEFGREFHYGYLEDVKVNLYSRVSYGENIGIARISENMNDGNYFLSIKDGDDYLSVIDVVNDEN